MLQDTHTHNLDTKIFFGSVFCGDVVYFFFVVFVDEWKFLIMLLNLLIIGLYKVRPSSVLRKFPYSEFTTVFSYILFRKY